MKRLILLYGLGIFFSAHPAADSIFHIQLAHDVTSHLPTFQEQLSFRNEVIGNAGAAYDAYESQQAASKYYAYLYACNGIDTVWADSQARNLATRCTVINFLNGGMLAAQNKAPSQLPKDFREDFGGMAWHPIEWWHGDRGCDQYRADFNQQIAHDERCKNNEAMYERVQMRKWALYQYPGFRKFLRTLSVYDDYLPEIAAQLEHDAEFARSLTDLNPKLPELIAHEVKFLHEKERQQTTQKTFSTHVHDLEDEINDGLELHQFYHTHQLPDHGRFERRVTSINEIEKCGPMYRTDSYSLTQDARESLNALNLDSGVYTACYGNQLQQVIHGECIELINRAGNLNKNAPLYAYKNPLIECIDAAREYNQGGWCKKALTVVDFCWTIFDCGSAVIEGAVLGVKGAVVDLISHPLHTTACAFAGTYVFAYQLSKIAVNVLKLGALALFDPDAASKEWAAYIKPVKQLIETINYEEVKLRDVMKWSTHVGVYLIAQYKVLKGLSAIGALAKNQKEILIPAKVEPKHTNSVIEEKFLPALPDKISWEEAVEISVKDAMRANKFTHIFKKKRHLLDPLVEKLGGEGNMIRKLLTILKNKLPENGVFDEISINIEGFEIWVSGRVINSVPRIGTFFIPDEKGKTYALAKKLAKQIAATRRQSSLG